MKGIKIMLCGLGLIFTALFCLLASRNYAVGLTFGILFLLVGIALMVIGLIVKDSLSELKSIKIVEKPEKTVTEEPVKAAPAESGSDKTEGEKKSE